MADDRIDKRQNYNIKIQLKAIKSKDHAEIKYRNTMQKYKREM